MKKLLFAIIIFSFGYSFAQQIKGTIKDKNGALIDISYLEFKDENDLNQNTEFLTVENGKFNYKLLKKYDKLYVEISSSGYLTKKIKLENVNSSNSELNIEMLEDKEIILKEVVIINQKKDVIVKEDTLKYNVSKFRDGTEKKIEDIIKKLPGISVNEKTGEIKYKGKSIEAVTLDGDNMFGYNYSLGTKNINVDMVDQVQAIDNYSENPLLKGIESGDKVSLNLKLKKGKSDYTGNIDFGVGLNKNNQFLNNSVVNILQVSKNYKSFGTVSFNNIGENNSPFDYFSGTQNIEQIKGKNFETYKIIPETLFSNIIENNRTNNNNMIFANYNNIFKINKHISIKSNFYYLKDNIYFQQIINTTNILSNQTLTTSDNNTSNKKPNLYRGDLELKFNTSKNSLLEYKTKFNFEETSTKTTIIANQINKFETDLTSKNQFFNQNLIFTKKTSKASALQLNINQGFNDVPQILSLTSTNNVNLQNSTFKKEYVNGIINLLGNAKKIKYSFSFETNYEKTDFVSFNKFQNSTTSTVIDQNKTTYLKNVINQLGSVNFTVSDWTFSPSYSVKLLKQSLIDNFLNQRESKNNLIFEPSILLKYKINSISFITSRWSNFQNPIVEEYIFKNSVVISNRVKLANSPSLNLQKSTIVSLNYINNNIYKQLQLELGFNYQKNKGGYYSNYSINQNETILKNIYLSEKNDNININFILVKYVPLISTSIKIKTNYNYSNYFNLLNSNDLRNNISNQLSNELSMRTSFKSKINFDNNLIVIQNNNKNDESEKIINNSIINSFKMRYKPNKKIFVVISSDYYLPDTKNKENNYLFLDMNIKFKPNNKHFEINLNAKNLLDKKVFSQIQTTDFSRGIFQNNLISRYIFINFTYDL